jgi:alpha-ketoglutarate-dependent taurine dioxygenase
MVRARAVPGSLAALVEPASPGDRDLAGKLAANRAILREAIYRHGALLFRGFPVAGAAEFERVVHAFSDSTYSYVGGGSPRSRISGEVFTSTEYAASAVIPLHNEASYFPVIPEFIWFHCAIAPEIEGETPLGDMRKVMQRLDPALVRRFDEKGVLYVTNLHGGKGFGNAWQKTYQMEDRTKVEDMIRGRGQTFEWTDDGGLRVAMRGPGLRRHSATGDAFWGNQASNWHAASLPEKSRAAMQRLYADPMRFPKMAFYGDGEPIDDDDIRAIDRTLGEEETVFRWQAGDVLLVDNQAIAHGRRAFKGARQIMVALT